METSSLETVSAFRDLPPISDVALEVVRRTTQEDLEAGDLAKIIAKDPGLALKVLRVANSPFYGLRTQVKTLQQAIVVLGQLSVVSICCTISTLGVLTARHPVAHPRYSNTALRRHALLTAVVARCVAAQSDAPRLPAADAYMAGLLHDIGELALAVFFAPRLKALLEFETAHPDCSRIEAQRQSLGCDHQSIGADVLQRWHLPPMFIHVARHHHDDGPMLDGLEGAMVKLIGAAAAMAEVLLPAWEPDGSGQTRASVPGGRDTIRSEMARVGPSLYGCLQAHVDSLLAETMMMEQCCA
jgi:HD-like signal output (HDOD) protein